MSFLGILHQKLPVEDLPAGFFLECPGCTVDTLRGTYLGAVFAFVQLSSGGIDILYSALLLIVYSIGVSIPMLIIAYSGKAVSGNVKWFVRRGHFLRGFRD